MRPIPESARTTMTSLFPAPATPAPRTARTRPLSEVPAQVEAAVALLRSSGALTPLTEAEAHCVAAHMRHVSYPAGSTVIREGDQVHTGYMLLLLGGEVLVETDGEGAGIEVSVLGPGNFVGEMALLDGEPRSLSCKAATPIEAAGLSRDAVDLLLRDHPVVCAKLMMTIAKRLADRLRAAGEQLRMYAQLQGDVRPERGGR